MGELPNIQAVCLSCAMTGQKWEEKWMTQMILNSSCKMKCWKGKKPHWDGIRVYRLGSGTHKLHIISWVIIICSLTPWQSAKQLPLLYRNRNNQDRAIHSLSYTPPPKWQGFVVAIKKSFLLSVKPHNLDNGLEGLQGPLLLYKISVILGYHSWEAKFWTQAAEVPREASVSSATPEAGKPRKGMLALKVVAGIIKPQERRTNLLSMPLH